MSLKFVGKLPTKNSICKQLVTKYLRLDRSPIKSESGFQFGTGYRHLDMLNDIRNYLLHHPANNVDMSKLDHFILYDAVTDNYRDTIIRIFLENLCRNMEHMNLIELAIQLGILKQD